MSKVPVNLRFQQESNLTLVELLSKGFSLPVLQTFAKQDAHYPGEW